MIVILRLRSMRTPQSRREEDRRAQSKLEIVQKRLLTGSRALTAEKP
jgi:hypothetical protein